MTGTGRIYYIKQEGMVIATASGYSRKLHVSYGRSRCTHPAYRGQGLASQRVARLSADMLHEGRPPCLFNNDPQAALVNRKLGYQDIRFWTMLYV